MDNRTGCRAGFSDGRRGAAVAADELAASGARDGRGNADGRDRADRKRSALVLMKVPSRRRVTAEMLALLTLTVALLAADIRGVF